ncbi:MAG: cation:proton antiporter [Lachnospiraceae bacterium]|nr:cation:proton antiporter [Lachnospiraceae bacterium]
MNSLAEFYERYSFGSRVPEDILSISIMLLAGFLVTRITKKLKLPNVTAYIVAGILVGPYVLNLVPERFVEATAFLPDIALAFIAFGIGEFFKLDTLKKSGIKVFIITLFETMVSTLVVLILCLFVFELPFAFSAVLAALAAATAPASTMMTIRQTKAKGEFVDILLQVIALDNVISLIAYSVAISVATSHIAGKTISIIGSLIPFVTNIGVLVLGGVFGWFIVMFMKHRHSTDNRLIIAIAMLFTFCGIASIVGTSPLLGCMAMGTVYINMTDDDKLFLQLNYFNPPILLLFFVRSGISFNLSTLFSKGSFGALPLIWIGIGYFIVRILGKFIGSYSGSSLMHASSDVQKYLGFALIPQAGVAIGLAELGARALQGEMGEALLTIILASGILHELVGPATAKYALYKTGSYNEEDLRPELENDVETASDISHVNTPDPTGPDIQNADLLPDLKFSETDLYGIENLEERFYDEAALEYYDGRGEMDAVKKISLNKKKKNKDKKDKKKKSKK